MSLEAIDLGILMPAFLAGLLVLATHVPLGAQVLKKGIVFVDLAIAQIAALGVVAAGLLDLAPSGAAVQVAAAGAALLGAALLGWTERRWPEVQEAQIGVVFVLAATAGILLLAKNPHGGENLRDLLAGQILWVGYPRLLVPALASAAILALWFGWSARIGQRGFYLLFAGAVTVSVQLVGVYLVFATLIVPSLAVRDHPPARRLPLAYAVGALGYAVGLVLSAALDLPSGALIVWSLACFAVLAHWRAPPRSAEVGASQATGHRVVAATPLHGARRSRTQAPSARR